MMWGAAPARVRDAVALALLALAARLCVVAWAWSRVPPTADGKFYHVVAERIANGEGYTWLWPDGAVTFAAHYPIGYPALISLPYGLFGPVPGAVMVLNAALGALAVGVCHGICWRVLKQLRLHRVRLSAGVVGLLLALSPTLVGYTPALMTEGAVAAFLVFATRLALVNKGSGGRFASWGRLLALSGCLGAAVLLRPQSVLFAPVLGGLAVSGSLGRRFASAALVSLGCLAIVTPWTLRNCDKMERCVFVSANGGWNLLIGTFAEGNGAWVALDGERVPVECREVFQEAAKDKCFGQAGLRRIREGFGEWLALVPSKLRATLDHTAAASDHLAESGALGEPAKSRLKVLEFGVQRLAFALGLWGAWWITRARDEGRWRTYLRRALLLSGLVGFGGWSAACGWLSTLALLLFRLRVLTLVGVGAAVFAVVSTAAVHAAFFGAGRYALPLLLLTAPLTAVGVSGLLRAVYASRGSGELAEV